jgi:hypothetical protein
MNQMQTYLSQLIYQNQRDQPGQVDGLAVLQKQI